MMRASKEMLEELRRRLHLVRGFEGEGEEGADDSGSETDEGSEEDEGSEDDEEDDESEGEKSKDTETLKKALRTERRERRKFERELKRLQREQERANNKGKSDAETARKDADEAQAKNQKLAAGFKQTRIDSAIARAATKLKFRDVDDAMKLVDRSQIEVDQDDDDPTDVEIDETTVNDALKALAKAKPHLLIAAGDQESSGGNLGTRGQSKDELDEEKLREMYPVLRR